MRFYMTSCCPYCRRRVPTQKQIESLIKTMVYVMVGFKGGKYRDNVKEVSKAIVEMMDEKIPKNSCDDPWHKLTIDEYAYDHGGKCPELCPACGKY